MLLHSSVSSFISFTSPLPPWGAHSSWGWDSKVKRKPHLNSISPLPFEGCHLLREFLPTSGSWWEPVPGSFCLSDDRHVEKKVVITFPPLMFCSFPWDYNKQVWIICHTTTSFFLTEEGKWGISSLYFDEISVPWLRWLPKITHTSSCYRTSQSLNGMPRWWPPPWKVSFSAEIVNRFFPFISEVKARAHLKSPWKTEQSLV